MTPDLHDYARLLLRREPTRSLPLGILRERLRQAAGDRWSGVLPLEQALGTDPAFRLLTPPPLIQCTGSGYAPEQLAAGFPQPEPHVLLVEEPRQPDDGASPFGATCDSLLALLACEGMQADVAEAVATLEEIGRRLEDGAVFTDAAEAARSTTPPPGPPHPPPGRRGGRRPAARRPR